MILLCKYISFYIKLIFNIEIIRNNYKLITIIFRDLYIVNYVNYVNYVTYVT